MHIYSEKIVNLNANLIITWIQDQYVNFVTIRYLFVTNAHQELIV